MSLLVSASFPPACIAQGLLNEIVNCLGGNFKCYTSCLPLDNSGDPMINFFSIPLDASNCGDIEEPLCAVTDCTECKPCSGPMNNMYRCMILNNPEIDVDDDIRDLAFCPLSCDPNNALINVTRSFN